MLQHAPCLTPDDAGRLARELFGLEGRARALPSERDQNFLIEAAAGERLVLKIANALEPGPLLDAQQDAMRHLAARGCPVPRVLPMRDGATRREIPGTDGRRHSLWAVSYVSGVPLATLGHRSTALLEDLGERIGALAGALADFDHPALHRDFYWDLANARREIDAGRHLLRDDRLRAAVERVAATAGERVPAVAPALRRSVIHNDLNDHNVLIAPGARPGAAEARVAGFVDFGDMVYGWTVADLAIAAAYVAAGARDPLAAVAAVVRGHHRVFPLSEQELEALFALVGSRLAASACVAAAQRRERPDNAYLGVSQEAIRAALPAIACTPYQLATAVFREACGLEPVPASARVRGWLADRAHAMAPVLGIDPHTAPSIVLDLSVGSALVDGDPRGNAEPAITRRIAAAVADAGVGLAIGRYDEPRLLYTAPFFAGGPGLADERRTIHLGLDLFAAAGTAVHAPLDGVVHAFADNHAEQDYGPVILLRHATGDGTPFYTLYGHLSRESLDGMHAGRRIARGQPFATLGTPDTNVGWTPHLHLQIILDPLGLDCDFPGVAPVSQRAVWRSLSPDANLVARVPAGRFPPPPPTTPERLRRRRRHLGRNLSVAYDKPLTVERGWMQYLYDDAGRRYLDAYNNVPHVGHCHPRVVAAGRAQMGVLNTNTRYLSDQLTAYAERLTATLPASLEVCYFVNSASEANELALRLARAYTGRRDTVVLEAGYHGNTSTLIELSPYKHAGPGGHGAPEWVHVAPLPDDYRGPYRRGDLGGAGPAYARHVGEILERLQQAGRGAAAFIAETCPSVGGQIMLPAGYLAEVYGLVRAARGLCIADEVQTGLGRIGTHFWAFEAHGVVPDIVVMGKPLGNGHPIGALVTTRMVADAFETGMEYFNTFGGNTVSCAIGVAVLDVLRDEGLQAQALRVGDRLLGALRPLVERHALVGDVRGSGLFLGVELVRDRSTLAPAAAEASYLVNRMREEGILVGTDGPYHNVIKIRPPMPFTEADADVLSGTLIRILDEELASGGG